MRFISPDLNIPVNYFVQLEATDDELTALIHYLGFLVTEHVFDRVARDDRFAPSPVWRKWASGTFVGFSGDRVMLKGGHRFIDSYEPIGYLAAQSSHQSLLGYLKTCYAKIRQVRGVGSLNHHIAAFTGMYPNFRYTKQHELLLAKHGFAYLRMLEVYNLAEIDRDIKNAVEVGGGSCVNAAVMIGAFGCKYTVIDLPETISVGFSFLKTIFPELKIALPNIVHGHIAGGGDFSSLQEEHDVVFMLPYQTDLIGDSAMDMAFNVSSFQEMNIEVANEYLSLLHRVLKPGGALVLENLKVSREIEGNSFENYRLDGFTEMKMCKPTYANFVIRNLPRLEHFFYQGVKG